MRSVVTRAQARIAVLQGERMQGQCREEGQLLGFFGSN